VCWLIPKGTWQGKVILNRNTNRTEPEKHNEVERSMLQPLACCDGGMSQFCYKVSCYFTSAQQCKWDLLPQDLGWGFNSKHKQENTRTNEKIEGSGLPSLACCSGAMSQFCYKILSHYTCADWCQRHLTRKCLEKGCNSKHKQGKTTMLKIIAKSTLPPFPCCNWGTI
jgi:hypothetical protein